MGKKEVRNSKNLILLFFSRNFFTFQYELVFPYFQSWIPFWLHARPSNLLRKSFKGTLTIAIFVSFFKRKSRNFASSFKGTPLTFILRFFLKLSTSWENSFQCSFQPKQQYVTERHSTLLTHSNATSNHERNRFKEVHTFPAQNNMYFEKKKMSAKHLNFEKRNFHL